MGFGYMFLGFMFLAKATFKGIDFLPDLAGFLLMYVGLKTAANHCRCFDFTKMLCTLGIGIGAVKLGLEIYFAITNTMSYNFDMIFGISYEVFILFYVLSLLYSMYKIGKETDCPKVIRKSLRNIIVTIVFWGLAIASNIASKLIPVTEETSSFVKELPVFALVFSFLWLVIDGINVFNCYMYICLEGDEDMEDNRKRKYKTPFDYSKNKNSTISKKGRK